MLPGEALRSLHACAGWGHLVRGPAEPRRLAQRLIDGTADDILSPLAVATAALGDANAALDTAMETHKALADEESAAEKELDRARYALRDAVAAVVAPSPAVAQLIAEYDEARGRAAALADALRALSTYLTRASSRLNRLVRGYQPRIAAAIAAAVLIAG
jgi:hypothetical protein